MNVTAHAHSRIRTRQINPEDVSDVLDYGKQVRSRGADLFVVGRREIRRLAAVGIDVSHLDGIHIVTNGSDIITVYRSKDLSASLRYGSYPKWKSRRRAAARAALRVR